jgi:aminoglycoside phosphotransferase (APT) family kinase protein
MSTRCQHDVAAVAAQFRIDGEYQRAASYGSGHINDTYAAVFTQGGAQVRYIVQRINHNVFRQPVQLMENVERVTRHAREKLVEQGCKDIDRRVLTLIPALDGRSYHLDPDGNTWRVYVFIENAQTFDQIEISGQAYEAAKAFGTFTRMLHDLPPPRLTETIPAFHDTGSRFEVLVAAIDADTHNRAAGAKAEIGFALERESMVDVLLDLHRDGAIPERITHNDTKLNNVMLDDTTGEGVCVIDLDTVMPGLALYDFGDMVRTAARPTPEDERDLSRVAAQMEMFEAVTRGYLAAVGDVLTPAELDHLAFSARLITFETGIRFLADYLQGDVYFKTHSAEHNIVRTRVQFKMVESLEAHEDAMREIVRACTCGN